MSKYYQKYEHIVSEACRRALIRMQPEWIRNTLADGTFEVTTSVFSREHMYSVTLAHKESGKEFRAVEPVRSPHKDDTLKLEAVGLRMADNISEQIDDFRKNDGKCYFDKLLKEAADHRERLRQKQRRVLKAKAKTKARRAKEARTPEPLPTITKVCKICGPENPDNASWGACPHES